MEPHHGVTHKVSILQEYLIARHNLEPCKLTEQHTTGLPLTDVTSFSIQIIEGKNPSVLSCLPLDPNTPRILSSGAVNHLLPRNNSSKVSPASNIPF